MQLNWIKRFYSAKQNKKFGDKEQDYKDRCGLQLVKFDFGSTCPEMINAILCSYLRVTIS